VNEVDSNISNLDVARLYTYNLKKRE